MQEVKLRLERLGKDLVVTAIKKREKNKSLGGTDNSDGHTGMRLSRAQRRRLKVISNSRQAQDAVINACMEIGANCLISLNIPAALTGGKSRRLRSTREWDFRRLERMAKTYVARVLGVYPGWAGFVAVADLGRQSGRLGIHIACVYDGFGVTADGEPVQPHVGTLRCLWQRVLEEFFPREIKALKDGGHEGGIGSFHLGLSGVYDPKNHPPQRLGLYITKSFAELSLDWKPKYASCALAKCTSIPGRLRQARTCAREFIVGDGPMYKDKRARAFTERVKYLAGLSYGRAVKVRVNTVEVEKLRSRYKNREDLGYWRNLQQACFQLAGYYGFT